LPYDQLIGLIDVLIWPAIALSAIIFFRKVFTYLFFPMEEFNFFGNRGSLKNIQDVIEEKAQRIIEAEQKEKEKQFALKKIEDELENAKQSKDNMKDQAQGNLDLAREIFKKYKELSDEGTKLKKELAVLKQEKADRQARRAAMIERIRRSREEKYIEPSAKEIDAAGDAYIQQKMDEERGK
ncbi:MAG TPA: hypothetical protein VMZ91_09385, partial [Candidatus Paceibacterota bacterium]|nr:hypothetical protein [Candidatus Paceibacterota bacterium]